VKHHHENHLSFNVKSGGPRPLFAVLVHTPAWVQTAARFNPFQWFLDGLRGALSLDPGGWLVSLGLLVILLLAALALAVRTFRFSEV
jgi:ABC-2 type transport system permease protein